MNEKDWELIMTLHNEGTITRAAQKLYISQPALTYRIKKIEEEFNTTIIYRGNNGVIFSSEGEYLAHYAKLMIKELQKTKDNIINMKQEVQGTLHIGVSSNFALYKLPYLLKEFLAKYPRVEISLTTGWSSKILKLIQSEDVHVAILRGENNWSGSQLILNRETICVASKDKINLKDLPLLNQIRYQTDFHLKNTFEEWWQHSYDVPPVVSMEVDRIETCKELVKKGLGYAVFPSISLKDEDELHTIDITKNNKKILRKTSMLYREELMDLNVVHAFVTFVKEHYQL